jgi:hypothetical protein
MQDQAESYSETVVSEFFGLYFLNRHGLCPSRMWILSACSRSQVQNEATSLYGVNMSRLCHGGGTLTEIVYTVIIHLWMLSIGISLTTTMKLDSRDADTR